MFYLVSNEIDSFWMAFNGFHWVLLGFTGFYWVLLGFTQFYLVLLSFSCVKPSFYLIVLCFLDGSDPIDAAHNVRPAVRKWQKQKKDENSFEKERERELTINVEWACGETARCAWWKSFFVFFFNLFFIFFPFFFTAPSWFDPQPPPNPVFFFINLSGSLFLFFSAFLCYFYWFRYSRSLISTGFT